MRGSVHSALILFGAVSGFCFTSASARAQEWGTVKGQVVFAGNVLPQPKEIDVGSNQDKQHCLTKGPLFSEEWTINPANKGVRWAFAWLAPQGSGPLPVHPDLKQVPQKNVEVDQPTCKFEPHAVGLRQGQVLVAKNSAPVTHNINWAGIKNPGGNVLLPPGMAQAINNLVADRTPLKLSCNIHPWMSAWVRIFDHPYFAVTDADGKFTIKLAPAGNYRLVTWQEAVGYGPGGRMGTPITIKAKGDTDVGKIELKPEANK